MTACPWERLNVVELAICDGGIATSSFRWEIALRCMRNPKFPFARKGKGGNAPICLPQVPTAAWMGCRTFVSPVGEYDAATEGWSRERHAVAVTLISCGRGRGVIDRCGSLLSLPIG